MKFFYYILFGTLIFNGCSSSYPTNHIAVKTTHVEEEKPDKYPHPPEDLRSVVGHEGWYRYGNYYYPNRGYYNRYSDYYQYNY